MRSLNPKVSIVVPCYNTEKYLSETLDSLLSQTVDGFEVIVVNDGSTDHSSEVIQKYSYKLTVAEDQINRGLAEPLNADWKVAKGSWIGYLGADDTFAKQDFLKSEEPIEVIYNFFSENTNADRYLLGYSRLVSALFHFPRILRAYKLIISAFVGRYCSKRRWKYH